MHNFFKISLIFLFILNVTLPEANPLPGNFRIYPGSITQTEPIVTISPLNPLVMFASAVTINPTNGFRSEGIYITTNGGLNWSGSDTCTGAYLYNHGGDPGVAITNTGALVLTHIGSIFYGVYSHYSTNMGNTWSAAYTITNIQPEDKGTTTSDNNPASPYFGRVYTAWVNFISPFPVLFSYSSNSGVNWSTPAAVNGSPPVRSSGGYIETGLDGGIHVIWSGVTSVTPFTEIFAGFAVSTNGGSSWNVSQNAYTMNGISGTLPQKGNIRVNGLPKIDIDRSSGLRRGWIYAITNEKNLSPAGSDPDIILHRSTDGGATWSAGIRINQDAINNGKTQYFPAIVTDSSGGINVIYYDDRNTTTDSAEVYLSRSTDGGNNWSDIVLSNHRFKPKPIVGGASGYQGDFISVVSHGTKLYPFWMDDYSGIYQVWTSVIDLNTIGIKKEGIEIPAEYSLNQNYPNPFNPMTKISFQLSVAGNVSLKIFDMLGREAATPVNEKLSAGTYSVDWNASDFASGVYFYRLTVNSANNDMVYSQTRKMIILK
ncbi:MAG: T9SS type A sorting domain-containing protein [Ignavibacteriae bacterium]|nr:T9SS type A sorting domain-containing protein [Ignavibacteriota bacterium]